MSRASSPAQRRSASPSPVSVISVRRALLLAALLALLSLTFAACGDDSDTTTTAGSDTSVGGDTDAGGDTSSDSTAAPAPPAGDKLFATLCAGCHGGDGVSGFAPKLAGVEADDIREAVTQGKGDMPGFGDKLSTEEVDAIVEYVGSL